MSEQRQEVRPVAFPTLSDEPVVRYAIPWDLLASLELPVQVELGRVEVSLQELLELTPGSVLELTRLSVNLWRSMSAGRLIAKGEVVVVLGERLGVRITELIKPT